MRSAEETQGQLSGQVIGLSPPYNWRVLTDEDRRWFSAQLHGFETSWPNNLHKQPGESLEPIAQRLDQFEASLITEFRSWATRMELRQQAHAAALDALGAELASLADRIKKLEGRRA